MQNSAKPPKESRKIGEGHAQAIARQGLKELQAAILTESNVARDAEPGTFGTPTQGEIAAERRQSDAPFVLDKHVHDARARTKARGVSETERSVHGEPQVNQPEPERE